MNRIVDNVVIIDSAMGNSLILTSAGQAVNISHFYVNAFAFLVTDTLSLIRISTSDTTNTIYQEGFITGAGASGGSDLFKFRPFGTPQRFDTLKVPQLTTGTGFIYLV